MSRTERLAEPEQFGKYQLVARLAHGRMGDVYKAKVHGVEGFERILVVKTLHTGYAAVPGFLDIVVEEAHRARAQAKAQDVVVEVAVIVEEALLGVAQDVAGKDVPRESAASDYLEAGRPPIGGTPLR